MGNNTWNLWRPHLKVKTNEQLIEELAALRCSDPNQTPVVAVADAHVAFWSHGRLAGHLQRISEGLQGKGVGLQVRHRGQALRVHCPRRSHGAGRPPLRRPPPAARRRRLVASSARLPPLL